MVGIPGSLYETFFLFVLALDWLQPRKQLEAASKAGGSGWWHRKHSFSLIYARSNFQRRLDNSRKRIPLRTLWGSWSKAILSKEDRTYLRLAQQGSSMGSLLLMPVSLGKPLLRSSIASGKVFVVVESWSESQAARAYEIPRTRRRYYKNLPGIYVIYLMWSMSAIQKLDLQSTRVAFVQQHDSCHGWLLNAFGCSLLWLRRSKKISPASRIWVEWGHLHEKSSNRELLRF